MSRTTTPIPENIIIPVNKLLKSILRNYDLTDKKTYESVSFEDLMKKYSHSTFVLTCDTLTPEPESESKKTTKVTQDKIFNICSRRKTLPHTPSGKQSIDHLKTLGDANGVEFDHTSINNAFDPTNKDTWAPFVINGEVPEDVVIPEEIRVDITKALKTPGNTPVKAVPEATVVVEKSEVDTDLPEKIPNLLPNKDGKITFRPIKIDSANGKKVLKAIRAVEAEHNVLFALAGITAFHQFCFECFTIF